jgi:aspartyl-tRNA(Asn)/glutamyl-tRNA(Gln) amidotransferase subunit A
MNNARTHRVEARAATAVVKDGETLTWLPAWHLREMIVKREISPVEVTNHFLGRIEELNPLLRSFRVVDYTGAREQAILAERAVMAGELLGPLHGIPIALKEDMAIKGLPAGSLATLTLAPAPRDSIQAERLRKAGAILVGSTVALAPRGAASGTPFDDVGEGRPRNPWDTARVPGISSAGSASAAAGALVPLTIGSDGGGSVRVPGAFCGLVGLHSTRGRIPAHQLQSPRVFLEVTTGPMTRDVRDAAIVLQAMAGPDGRDLVSLQDDPPDYLDSLHRGVEGLRLAWTDDFGFASKYALPETPRVIEVVRNAVFGLSKVGAIVEKADQEWEDPTGEEFELALEVQDRNWHRLRSVLAKYDLLLSPTVQFTAPSFNEWDAIFARDPKFIHHLGANTLMFNRLGFPAATVPAGFVEAMPVGVQIVGRPNSEARILQLAHAFLKLSA